MRIAHVAVWCRDLNRVTAFWVEYFGAKAGEPYVSERRPGFVSRFVRLDEGTTLELMSAPWLEGREDTSSERVGWAHVAISVGSEAAVDALSARVQIAGQLVAMPRWTGDGFYEAVVRDPEDNLIEITA